MITENQYFSRITLVQKDKPMELYVNDFCQDESGAVTVDWVVLTAAIIGLGMLVLIPIAFSTTSSSQGVADYIGNINAGYSNN